MPLPQTLGLDFYSRNGRRISRTGPQTGAVLFIEDNNLQYEPLYSALAFRLSALDRISVEAGGSKKRPRRVFAGDFFVGNNYRKPNSRIQMELLPPVPIADIQFEQITSYTARHYNKLPDGTPVSAPDLRFYPDRLINMNPKPLDPFQSTRDEPENIPTTPILNTPGATQVPVKAPVQEPVPQEESIASMFPVNTKIPVEYAEKLAPMLKGTVYASKLDEAVSFLMSILGEKLTGPEIRLRAVTESSNVLRSYPGLPNFTGLSDFDERPLDSELVSQLQNFFYLLPINTIDPYLSLISVGCALNSPLGWAVLNSMNVLKSGEYDKLKNKSSESAEILKRITMNPEYLHRFSRSFSERLGLSGNDLESIQSVAANLIPVYDALGTVIDPGVLKNRQVLSGLLVESCAAADFDGEMNELCKKYVEPGDVKLFNALIEMQKGKNYVADDTPLSSEEETWKKAFLEGLSKIPQMSFINVAVAGALTVSVFKGVPYLMGLPINFWVRAAFREGARTVLAGSVGEFIATLVEVVNNQQAGFNAHMRFFNILAMGAIYRHSRRGRFRNMALGALSLGRLAPLMFNLASEGSKAAIKTGYEYVKSGIGNTFSIFFSKLTDSLESLSSDFQGSPEQVKKLLESAKNWDQFSYARARLAEIESSDLSETEKNKAIMKLRIYCDFDMPKGVEECSLAISDVYDVYSLLHSGEFESKYVDIPVDTITNPTSPNVLKFTNYKNSKAFNPLADVTRPVLMTAKDKNGNYLYGANGIISVPVREINGEYVLASSDLKKFRDAISEKPGAILGQLWTEKAEYTPYLTVPVVKGMYPTALHDSFTSIFVPQSLVDDTKANLSQIKNSLLQGAVGTLNLLALVFPAAKPAAITGNAIYTFYWSSGAIMGTIEDVAKAIQANPEVYREAELENVELTSINYANIPGDENQPPNKKDNIQV